MVLVNVIIGGLLIGGVYALFSVGLSLLLGALRIFNLMHGSVLTASTLITIAFAHRHPGLHLFSLLVIGALVGAALGIPIEFLAIRPFRRRGLSREDMQHATMLATLAGVLIANDLMTHYTNAATRYFPYGSFPTNIVSIGGVQEGVIYPISFGVGVGLLGVVASVLRFTSVGRTVRAIASDHRAASLLGVNVNRYSLVCLMTSCALAGVAGVLLGMVFTSVTYSFGDDLLFQGFIIIVVGGLGSIGGTLCAALGLGVLEGVASYYTGGTWGELAAFGVFMLVLLYRPQGLFGKPEAFRA
jgi:branched-chain amino acid transport system permease protein